MCRFCRLRQSLRGVALLEDELLTTTGTGTSVGQHFINVKHLHELTLQKESLRSNTAAPAATRTAELPAAVTAAAEAAAAAVVANYHQGHLGAVDALTALAGTSSNSSSGPGGATGSATGTVLVVQM
jgi:hypothetical protein